MTNVEKLKQLGILGVIRQRLGANSETDKSFDEDINKESNHKLIKYYCGWYLGDGSWWDDFKNLFDKLESL